MAAHDVSWNLLWWDVEPSVLVVMAAGITAGSVVKSITGFGSTIAHLCIWSLARAAGIEAGTLAQAVITEVIFRTVTAIPYLAMTRARQTANVKLVVSISLFQTLGSPLGAWLLAYLDQHALELCLAGALLAVLLAQWLSWLLISQPINDSPITTHTATQPAHKDKADSVIHVHDALAQPLLGPAAGDHTLFPAAPEAWDAQQDSVLFAHGKTVASQGISRDSLSSPASTDPSDNLGSSDSMQHSNRAHSLGHYSLQDSSMTDTDSLQDHSGAGKQLDSWLWLLGAGSVAGTLSGVMGGLTGIDGPPTIFMFTWLKADKAVVRGTNAVINCFLMVALLTSYTVQGLFAWQDTPLYLVGAVFGWFGTVWGNHLSGLMSQLAFTRILNAMVVLCAGMMLWSAFM